MARQESDREDLLREAIALTERIELAPIDATGDERNVVVGFRDSGATSIYFGPDPAYHFNSRGKLRRAFERGLLFKAEQMRLIELARVRLEGSIELRRRTLREDEQALFLERMRERLEKLRGQIREGSLRVVGQVPPDADVLGRALRWLDEHREVSVARSPHAR